MNDPKTISELRDGLRAAIEARDEERLLYLVNGYSKPILESFPDWQKVPEEFRATSEGQQRWGHFLVTLAKLFQDNDIPDLMNLLTGGPDNPLTRWQAAFDRADRLAQAGHYEQSNAVLLPVIGELVKVQGTAVDRLHGAVLGMLGTNFFRLGNREEARRFTEKALAECTRVGDTDGVRTYAENLAILARGGR